MGDRIEYDKLGVLQEDLAQVQKIGKESYLKFFSSYCWTLPREKPRVFTMLLTLFGQFSFIEVLDTTHDAAVYGMYLKNLHNLAVTNGFAAEDNANLSDMTDCNLRLVPKSGIPEGVKDIEYRMEDRYGTHYFVRINE